MSTVERAHGGAEIEVTAKATRRRFTLDYKRRIVREADRCKTPGAGGALLRREGLYSSYLTTWRERVIHETRARQEIGRRMTTRSRRPSSRRSSSGRISRTVSA